MEENFSVEIRSAAGAVVLGLRGDVDGRSSELGRAYDRATREQPEGEVILDFADVEYINSSGIALIVSVLARARAAGRHVVALGLSAHYRQIFEITRLSDFIELRSGPGEGEGAQADGRRPAAAEE